MDLGIDPKMLSDRIGHANTSVTLQIYTHRSARTRPGDGSDARGDHPDSHQIEPPEPDPPSAPEPNDDDALNTETGHSD